MTTQMIFNGDFATVAADVDDDGGDSPHDSPHSLLSSPPLSVPLWDHFDDAVAGVVSLPCYGRRYSRRWRRIIPDAPAQGAPCRPGRWPSTRVPRRAPWHALVLGKVVLGLSELHVTRAVLDKLVVDICFLLFS